MLKRGISLGLLCITGHAYSANITVKTTEDVVKADAQRSLREAITYINQGMPEAGYNGCGGKDASSIIELVGKSEYKINSQLTISKPLLIKSVYENAAIDSLLGKNNAVIKMAGKDRIFLIDRTLAPNFDQVTDKDSLITASLNEITLNGCDQDSCADQGGLIFNKENILLQYAQLLNGKARQGGAIYNAGAYTESKPLSSVGVTNSLLRGNTANQGGVIYSVMPQFIVTNSVVRDNEVKNADASLFESEQAFDEKTSNNIGTTSGRGMINTTMFSNKGYTIKVMDGMMVNNITMVMNTKGLIINAPFKNAYVVNSILAKNGTEDCRVIAGAEANKISNNLYSVGCAGSASQLIGTANLIAGTSVEGKCDVNSDGLLCPFAESDKTILGYFRPRLLTNYTTLADSLIVNKGPQTGSDLMSCITADQRGLSRPGSVELCDRGAIELVVDKTTTTSVGKDIFYGEIAKFTLADQLQDGDLITPAQCKVIMGSELDPQGKTWLPGCLKVVQTNTPSKGALSITQEGDITYVPNGNWHGADEFNILVVTTTTRFNDSRNPYIEVPAKVVQDPPNTFEDKKVKTSGGSTGIFALLGLIGLVGFRRFKK